MSFFKNVKHLFIPDTIYTDRYPDLETALIAKAPLNVVQALLRYEKYQKQLHWTDWRGDDVFQLAIIQKVDNAILKLLITKGANFRHFNKNGHCALHLAPIS